MLHKLVLRILSFADFYANADPLYKMFNILKLNDNIALQNRIFVHDFVNNKLPIFFNSYFQSISDIHSINTKGSEQGCIHIPFFTTTKYGLNSFTRKCIDSWNLFTKQFNCNLSTLGRSMLKRKILSYFIESY